MKLPEEIVRRLKKNNPVQLLVRNVRFLEGALSFSLDVRVRLPGKPDVTVLPAGKPDVTVLPSGRTYHYNGKVR